DARRGIENAASSTPSVHCFQEADALVIGHAVGAGNIRKGEAGTVEIFNEELVTLLRYRAQRTFLRRVGAYLAGEGVEVAGWRAVDQLTVVQQAIRGRKRRTAQIFCGKA